METIQIALYRQKPVEFDIEQGKTPVVRWPPRLRLPPLVHAMCNVNRFTGQTETGYSVAEHSVRLRDIVDREYRDKRLNRACLLHDFPECLGINDLHTRVKSLLAPDVKELEDVVMQGLWDRFGDPGFPLWPLLHDRIKPWDRLLGDYEKNQLFTPTNAIVTHRHCLRYGNPGIWSPAHSERQWHNRWTRDNT